jgi:uncharacterized protein YjiS (DUF1127 family)
MHASDDFYFLRFEHRPLTPEEWTRLKQGARQRAEKERVRALRAMLAGVPKLAVVAVRSVWAMGRTVVRSAGEWSSTYAAWRMRRRAIKELRGLDDRVLKDIGLHRSEIESVVRGQDSGPVAEGKVAVSLCPKPYVSGRIATKGATRQLMEKNAA